MSVEEDISVTRFREYLRINTMQPNPDYAAAVTWLLAYAKELGIPARTVTPYPERPFVIMTLEGREPSLPSVFLYSHTDVVPVFPDKWTHPPFSAHKDEKGDIYARGAQDMKCVGIQYCEALRRLRKAGQASFLRTLHIVWGPDEEITGKLGMAKFVLTEELEKLNIGFALDEGIASPDDTYIVSYAERCMWWLTVHADGDPGHGSKFIKNTAAEKLRRVINSFLDFRAEQEAALEAGAGRLRIGDVVSVNLTKVEGGVQLNVVPARLSASFDIRVPPTVDEAALKAKFERFCSEAGKDVSMEWHNYYFIKQTTDTTDASPWWRAFSGALSSLGLKTRTEIFTGGTDARFLRERGVPALGFSPMANTPVLLHDHDERLNEKTFLHGVTVYQTLLPAMANVPAK